MKINTKELKEIVKKLALVLNACPEATALNIKSNVDNTALYFSMDTGEIYTALKLFIMADSYFNATVDTKSFIDMVSSLAGDEITLLCDNNLLKLSSGKSKYKLPMLYVDGQLLEHRPILVENKEVDIRVSLTTLRSIDAINSQEFSRVSDNKIKNQANKLYHISDAGCFTAANNFGACLNSFKLGTQIDLLATRSLVKLFSLFDTDPNLVYEHKRVNNIEQAIVNLRSDKVMVCALTPADPKIRAVITSMVTKIRQRATAIYQANIVINTKELSGALSRLAVAAKHNTRAIDEADKVKLTVVDKIVMLTDGNDNSEEIALHGSTELVGKYTVSFFVSTVRPIVDLCKDEFITIRGNQGTPFVIDFGSVKYMLVPLID